MAVPFSNTKLRVPHGFQNILEAFAREVLRNQPNDIHASGAVFFEDLLKKREYGGVDPAEHGAAQEDRYYNNKAFTKPDIDQSDPQQQDAALKIQTKYRQHHAKKTVKTKREEKAAVKIQSGYRGYQDRQKVKSLKTSSEGEAVTEPEETAPSQPPAEEEIDIDLNDPEVSAAATKIQAGFRGHKARKEVADKKAEAVAKETEGEPKQEEIDPNDPDANAAAVKIQAGFKGYKTRKELNARRVQSKGDEPAEETAAAEVVKETAEQDGQEAAAAEATGKEGDIDLNDPETAAAATKIQAGFRGHQARKDVKAKKEAISQNETADSPDKKTDEETTAEGATGAEEKVGEPTTGEVDLDLNDEELQNAAVKIQAGFKGYKTRREYSAKKKEQAGENADGTAEAKPEDAAATEGEQTGEEAATEGVAAQEGTAEEDAAAGEGVQAKEETSPAEGDGEQPTDETAQGEE